MRALSISQENSYYEVLEVDPDASPSEIREAYLRAKSAYDKDSMALYSVMSQEETEDVLERIEEAYQVLSHPERRKEYDRDHGVLSPEMMTTMEPSSSHPSHGKKVISIDRVPPMDQNASGEELLEAPATDFVATDAPEGRLPSDSEAVVESPFETQSQAEPENSPFTYSSDLKDASPAFKHRPKGNELGGDLKEAIEQEVEWSGAFLRKVRQAKDVSEEEMIDYTKITKTYLRSIEEEAFDKLPAAVYVRGFVIQIAKMMKLDHEKVASAYMARFYQARPPQD